MKAQDTNIHRLLQGTKVFIVPNFQRRYSWKLEQWSDLWRDILQEYTDTLSSGIGNELDGHFLGSVVLHPAPGPASTVARYLVIDGQQRLTTLIVLLAALRDARKASDPEFDPAEYNSQYLYNSYNAKDPDRLVPTTFDRTAYIATVRSGSPTGGIGQAYTWFSDQLQLEKRNDPSFDFAHLGDVLLLRLLVVEISTSPRDSVNNIFNTLNSKGMPLSPTDLIRNEFLLNLSPEKAEACYEFYWLPMERQLVRNKLSSGGIDDSQLIAYFAAQELRMNQNLAVKDLFGAFEQRLRKLLDSRTGPDREAVVVRELSRLNEEHDLYLAISQPSHDTGAAGLLSSEIRKRLRQLNSWSSSPSIPLIFAIVAAYASGRASLDVTTAALDMLESYLVRRALAGIATNNLNRLLSALPAAIESLSDESIITALEEILSRPAYRWPTDRELVNASETTALYLTTKKPQSRYILYRLATAVEPKELIQPVGLSVEHIMPQTLTIQWTKALLELRNDLEDTKALLHTLGNLTLSGYHASMGNATFGEKRVKLASSSLRINRDIAEAEYWDASTIRERGRHLSELATEIWRIPRAAVSAQHDPSSIEISSQDGLKVALNSVPEGSWTTDEALSELLAMDISQIRRIVAAQGPELARMVRMRDGKIPDWMPAELAKSIEDQVIRLDELDAGDFIDSKDLAEILKWSDADDTAELED